MPIVNAGLWIAPLCPAICAAVPLGLAAVSAIAGPAAPVLFTMLAGQSYAACCASCVSWSAVASFGSCFDENTFINIGGTIGTEVPITALSIGQKIGAGDNDYVTDVIVKDGIFDFVWVETAGGSINVTTMHLMITYVENQRFIKPAKLLIVGDVMENKNGGLDVVENVQYVIKNKKIDVKTASGLLVANNIKTTALCEIVPNTTIPFEEYFANYHHKPLVNRNITKLMHLY